MHGQGAEQLGAPGAKPQSDDGTERVPSHMGGGEVEGLDERRQVVDVLVEGALAGRGLALAVAAAVSLISRRIWRGLKS